MIYCAVILALLGVCATWLIIWKNNKFYKKTINEISSNQAGTIAMLASFRKASDDDKLKVLEGISNLQVLIERGLYSLKENTDSKFLEQLNVIKNNIQLVIETTNKVNDFATEQDNIGKSIGDIKELNITITSQLDNIINEQRNCDKNINKNHDSIRRLTEIVSETAGSILPKFEAAMHKSTELLQRDLIELSLSERSAIQVFESGHKNIQCEISTGLKTVNQTFSSLSQNVDDAILLVAKLNGFRNMEFLIGVPEGAKETITKGSVTKIFSPGKLGKVIDKNNDTEINYIYNEDKTITSETHINGLLRYRVFHSDYGAPLDGISYDTNGKILNHYKYDSNGQIIKK